MWTLELLSRSCFSGQSFHSSENSGFIHQPSRVGRDIWKLLESVAGSGQLEVARGGAQECRLSLGMEASVLL